MDADGKPAHAGNMRAQVNQALDNLEKVLAEGGFRLVDQLFANWDAVTNRLTQAGCRPSSTLLGVSRLAFPELLIEIEAAAVQ